MCKGQVDDLVPLSWTPCPGGECLACHKKRCSNVRYITLDPNPLFASVDGVDDGNDRLVYKEPMLVAVAKDAIVTMLASDGYETNDVLAIAPRMASSFLMHVSFGLRSFVTTMTPFYWLSLRAGTKG